MTTTQTTAAKMTLVAAATTTATATTTVTTTTTTTKTATTTKTGRHAHYRRRLTFIIGWVLCLFSYVRISKFQSSNNSASLEEKVLPLVDPTIATTTTTTTTTTATADLSNITTSSQSKQKHDKNYDDNEEMMTCIFSPNNSDDCLVALSKFLCADQPLPLIKIPSPQLHGAVNEMNVAQGTSNITQQNHQNHLHFGKDDMTGVLAVSDDAIRQLDEVYLSQRRLLLLGDSTMGPSQLGKHMMSQLLNDKITHNQACSDDDMMEGTDKHDSSNDNDTYNNEGKKKKKEGAKQFYYKCNQLMGKRCKSQDIFGMSLAENWTLPDPTKEGPVVFGLENPFCSDCSRCHTRLLNCIPTRRIQKRKMNINITSTNANDKKNHFDCTKGNNVNGENDDDENNNTASTSDIQCADDDDENDDSEVIYDIIRNDKKPLCAIERRSTTSSTLSLTNRKNYIHGGYIPIEFARDVEWQTVDYKTTQENLIAYFFEHQQHHERNDTGRRHHHHQQQQTSSSSSSSSFAYNHPLLIRDFGRPICFVNSGHHDVTIPNITLQQYVQNVQWYIELLLPHCTFIVWLETTAPDEKEYDDYTNHDDSFGAETDVVKSTEQTQQQQQRQRQRQQEEQPKYYKRERYIQTQNLTKIWNGAIYEMFSTLSKNLSSMENYHHDEQQQQRRRRRRQSLQQQQRMRHDKNEKTDDRGSSNSSSSSSSSSSRNTNRIFYIKTYDASLDWPHDDHIHLHKSWYWSLAKMVLSALHSC